MKKYLPICLLIFFAVAIPSSTQGSRCSTIIQDALSTVGNLCSNTSRNQACYGNLSLIAEAQPGVESFKFDEPGDIVNIDQIQSLRLSALLEDVPEWGISLMNVQANVPNTLPGQNVTFLLFGDVAIQNATVATPEIEVTVSATVNVRSGPSTENSILTSLASGTTLTANGRDESAEWLRVRLPENDSEGWIATFLVQTSGNVESLNVTVPGSPMHRPLQAFYLTTGIGDSNCEEAPDSGILIQTPAGAGRIDLTINEVNITLGSTAYLHSQAGDLLAINVIEGEATVSAFNTTIIVPAGAKTTVPMDENLVASGSPTDPEPYEDERIDVLPVVALPQTIRVADPASETTISMALVDSTVNDLSRTVYLNACAQDGSQTVPANRELIVAIVADGFLTRELATASKQTLQRSVMVNGTSGTFMTTIDCECSANVFAYHTFFSIAGLPPGEHQIIGNLSGSINEQRSCTLIAE